MTTMLTSAPAPAMRAPGSPSQPGPTGPTSLLGAAHRVLVVEDSRSIRDLLVAFLETLDGIAIDVAATRAEAQRLLDAAPAPYLCAVLDLSLPDAPNGEVVDVALAQAIPIIVLTGSYSDELRLTLAAKGVFDYVVKRQTADLRRVAEIVRRLRDNPSFKVLVVDDSATFRDYATTLLHKHAYRTVCAADGREALQMLAEHPDICLVITDVHMPVMDGYELITAIRQRHTREELPIIGLSERTRAEVSVRLLNSGANDFLGKPFEVEEFHCRVGQNLDLLSYIRRLKEASQRDFLTGLWNRRHFFEAGDSLYRNALRQGEPVAVALLDIDHFKRINDDHGHAMGDQALRRVAEHIAMGLESGGLVARYGGEEFACVLTAEGALDVIDAMERLRASIENIVLHVGDTRLRLTVSCGVATSTSGDASLETLLDRADAALYNAKRSGRNRVSLAA